MPKAKTNHRKVTPAHTEPPLPIGFERSEQEEGELISHLVDMSLATALILWATPRHMLDEGDLDCLYGGLSKALHAAAGQVDLYISRSPGTLNPCAFPKHLAYVMEKKLTELRVRAEEGGNDAEDQN